MKQVVFVVFLVVSLILVPPVQAVVTPTACDADYDTSGEVSLIDYAWFVQYFSPSHQQHQKANLNQDSQVNLLDYAWFLQLFGEDCAPTPSPTIQPSPVPSPSSLPTPDISVSVDPTDKKNISPYIYGVNGKEYAHAQMIRAGGNRWTAYNWETNASNAGTDWNNSSDNYLCNSSGYTCGDANAPGEAVKVRVSDAFNKGAAALVTVPMVDYVAADKNGSVTSAASPNNSRWALNEPTKPANASSAMGDRYVYQSEFISFLENAFPQAGQSQPEIFYALDNEPGLWPETHPLVHGAKPTYSEMITRTTETASMIKTQAPTAKVFGAVAYGWGEFKNLQQAPDAGTQAPGQVGTTYLDFYLASMKHQSQSAGKRLVDVLDLHWYPEAKDPVSGCRITNCTSDTESKIQARVQAPRSLWDSSYTEDSWIAQWETQGPVQLFPRVKGSIGDNYPNTALSLSEYNYGGGNHISGALAQADVLGIFGRQGLFAASFWPMSDDNPFIYGAFDMYLNYDGQGSQVGSVSLHLTTPASDKVSLYAMSQPDQSTVSHVVAINKTNQPLVIQASWPTNTAQSQTAQVYHLTASSSTPQAAGSTTLHQGSLIYELPAYSVTTFAF